MHAADGSVATARAANAAGEGLRMGSRGASNLAVRLVALFASLLATDVDSKEILRSRCSACEAIAVELHE